ncbi:DNA-binding protein Alba [archaeon CG10_big_fil_rev_8_21_14_0_10_43_11]|nr:MAG: DNA-binding protein Alba [archaeon CG10_big_fil_rev_8_21_14_0_10_43_11]
MAASKKTSEKKSADNIIYIGIKPFMNYVTAAMLQFNGGAEIITLKARGKNISRAVDVTEVLRNRFMNDVKINAITIGSEKLTSREGKNTNVSIIEIALTK